MNIPESNHESADLGILTWTQIKKIFTPNRSKRLGFQIKTSTNLGLVEEMLLERGIVVSYETIRVWAMKFGAEYARR
jgi:hypothetical protein